MSIFAAPDALFQTLSGRDWMNLALSVVSSGALLYAALHDFAARTIPNQIPLGLLLIGLVQRALTHSLLSGAGCAALVFFLGVLCWQRGWLGGGDVKLIAAVAFVLPPGLCPGFIAAMALAGGILALIYATLAFAVGRRHPPPLRRRTGITVSLWRRVLCAERWRLSRGAPLPYATAIAAGFLFILFRG